MIVKAYDQDRTHVGEAAPRLNGYASEQWCFSLQCLMEQTARLQWQESVGIAIAGLHVMHNHLGRDGCDERCYIATVDPDNPTPFMRVVDGELVEAEIVQVKD